MRIFLTFSLVGSLALNVAFGLHYIDEWLDKYFESQVPPSLSTSEGDLQHSVIGQKTLDNEETVLVSGLDASKYKTEFIKESIPNNRFQDQSIHEMTLALMSQWREEMDETLLRKLLVSVQEFLTLQPTNTDALQLEIQIYLALNERADAIQLMLNLTGKEKPNPFLLETINEELSYHSKSGNYQRTIDLGNRWLNQLSDNIDIYIHIIEAYLALNNTIDADFLLNQLTLEQSKHPTILALRERLKQSTQASSTVEQVPLEKRGEHYIVTAFFADKPLELMIDTGATISALTEAQFDMLFGSVIFLEYREVSTANGIAVIDFYHSPTMRIGSQTHSPFEFGVMRSKRSGPGLLGMNFLSHYQFKIDQVTQQLILQPKLE